MSLAIRHSPKTLFSQCLSGYLSICHSFERGGKDTHPAAAPHFFPFSSQEVSHLPLCRLRASAQAQWCWNSVPRCEKLIGGTSTLAHGDFCKHTHVLHMRFHYREGDKPRWTGSCTRRHTADKLAIHARRTSPWKSLYLAQIDGCVVFTWCHRDLKDLRCAMEIVEFCGRICYHITVAKIRC